MGALEGIALATQNGVAMALFTSDKPAGSITSKAAWIFLAIVVFLYAPIAAEYMLGFFFPSVGLSNLIIGGLTSHEFAFGQGSVELDRAEIYASERRTLLIHTIGGSIAILLGICQFAGSIRQTHPKVHRYLGRVQIVVVLVSMIAAMTYLARTGPMNTFTGPPFWSQLWLAAITTFVLAIATVAFIRRGDVELHRTTNAVMLALLMTAPVLRIGWIIIGRLWPDKTMIEANLMMGSFLATIVLVGVVIATRVWDQRDARFASPPIPAAIRRAGYAFSGAAVVCLAIAYERLINSPTSTLYAFLASTAAFAGIMSCMWWRSRANGDIAAAREWALHLHFVSLTPVVLGAAWMLFAIFFDVSTAFYCAAFNAMALTLVPSIYAAVLLRRKSSFVADPPAARLRAASLA